MTDKSWKNQLQEKIPDVLAREIDVFEGQMALRRQDKLEERVFAETRLRRGVYGQRYDNGQRHDGTSDRPLPYPERHLTKGPDTLWHAPGMQRIKVPFGGLSPEQLEVMAQLAEEVADGILHITTRQDVQLHYVHIEDTPDLMRRLAAVGITTREACGNSVRNITACPLAGVCHTESFDVTPYADALTHFLLGHDDVQDFGRKFKIAFSGCEHEACGLTKMHDLGLLARTREVDGVQQRGFTVYIGGGLGTIPHLAKILYDFLPQEELLPLAQAISRVFARHGEKKNRNRARIKFLVAQLGVDAFRELVEEERQNLPPDERWTAYLHDLTRHTEKPRHGALPLNGALKPAGFAQWLRSNVYHQRQEGYAVATVHLPLGDLTSEQAFALADIARRFVGDTVRTTVEQNIVLRWVSEADLPALYQELRAIGLGDAGAGTIVDITSCPGTDTCKLGIAASRGLTGELRERLQAQEETLPAAVKELKIKVSGCFNSCGQHHVADIGFFGNSRRRNNQMVPHFQVVLGGRWHENAGSYGQMMGAVPSRAVPQLLEAITTRFAAERREDESFQEWIARLGKREVKALLAPYTEVPDRAVDPAFYSDWGDPREFSIGDIGVGECAGEVVSLFSIEISRAEGEAFDALVSLDEQDYVQADRRAYSAMLLAARALVRTQNLDVGDDPDRIVDEFRSRFYDTRLFFDRFARGKFAEYLFKRHESPPVEITADFALQLAEEAHLFIEAAHACEARLAQAGSSVIQIP